MKVHGIQNISIMIQKQKWFIHIGEDSYDDLDSFLRIINTSSLDLDVDISECYTLEILVWIENCRNFYPIYTEQVLRCPKYYTSNFGFVYSDKVKKTFKHIQIRSRKLSNIQSNSRQMYCVYPFAATFVHVICTLTAIESKSNT